MRSRLAVTLLAAGLAALGVAVAVSAQLGSSSATANDSLFASLAGSNESPAGDGNGRGSFAASFDGSRLCYGYSVKNIGKPAAAHIHRAGAGKVGGVVIPLNPPKAGDPGTATGCATVAAALRRAILQRPAGFYVNVHTAAFPGGAVRGQLFARSP